MLLEAVSDGKSACFIGFSANLRLADFFKRTTRAGHVIDQIAVALSSPDFKIEDMRWMDNNELDGPPASPVHYRNPKMKSWQNVDIDFGAISLGSLDKTSLLEGGRVQVLDLTDWRPPKSSPDGHFVLGYPLEWIEHSSHEISDNKVSHNLKADLAWLPLKRIYPPTDYTSNGFWDNPEAFYGEIVPFADRPQVTVRDIDGMSGGPVFSIQQMPDRNIMYRLVGIQRTWLPTRRVIRAEPTQKILELLDDWI